MLGWVPMSLWHLTRAVFETLRVCTPTVLESLRGRLTADRCDTRLQRWSARLLAQARMELEVLGAPNAPASEAFVVMSNHQSLYDIPVIFQALPRRLRMVAKAELFRLPIFARALRTSGFVEIDRRNTRKAIQSLRGAEGIVASGTSIWIAPEGTRSASGNVAEFKKGGFRLALASGARILPVTIDGTRDALVARGWTVRNGVTVRVTIGEPIDPAHYGLAQMDGLIRAVRNAIRAPLTQEQVHLEQIPASEPWSSVGSGGRSWPITRAAARIEPPL
ncbi:MAG TPA: lysophospholipid acyltransferase family protein [Polyangiaceae bacterium]|jgi:1-acyl-sn-glycerol-3-phosphate acyltransferase